jgi:hypothetical protein
MVQKMHNNGTLPPLLPKHRFVKAKQNQGIDTKPLAGIKVALLKWQR